MKKKKGVTGPAGKVRRRGPNPKKKKERSGGELEKRGNVEKNNWVGPEAKITGVGISWGGEKGEVCCMVQGEGGGEKGGSQQTTNGAFYNRGHLRIFLKT